MTALLEFDSVGLSFANRVVIENLSITIAEGEFACLVGPSGCGKTTLLRMVAGLLQPSQGQVRFRGQPVLEPSHDVAVVFQDYGRALLPWRTAAGNVSLALEAAGTAVSERKEIIAALLEKVGLQQHAQKFPGQLSGGMQQRLQIARCLAQRPRVLLMDEPFGALDAMTRQTLQDEVGRLVEGSNVTVLFVTHDLEEAIYLGDRVIALEANPGRIADVMEIGLPRPRVQLTTREDPEFLRLRHSLFGFVGNH
ncbi:MAG TPA: ABC transporter ATP-binding protein [Burkholderiaceae bacterium]|nr:ABC transporter ATP-binding protein [Burkholderiaceae bacterium]